MLANAHKLHRKRLFKVSTAHRRFMARAGRRMAVCSPIDLRERQWPAGL